MREKSIETEASNLFINCYPRSYKLSVEGQIVKAISSQGNHKLPDNYSAMSQYHKSHYGKYRDG